MIQSITHEGYRLFHDGALALVDMEEVGFLIDESYFQQTQRRLNRQIAKLKEKISTNQEVLAWKAAEGSSFNLKSNPQLARHLFTRMGIKSTKETAKGNPSVNEEALKATGVDFVLTILEARHLKTVLDKVKAFLREAVDQVVHPAYSLNIPKSLRGACSSPNMQNASKRDEEMARLVRTGILARPGRLLLEVDFSGAEVCCATCYHHDPVMMQYIKDNYDLHKEMASLCFKLDMDEITKPVRYVAKNRFVFPQFYGDYWKSCAEKMWQAATVMALASESGIPVAEHLRERFGTEEGFAAHVKKVERDFWERRFSVYAQWKKDWVELYHDQGYVDTLTGFRCSGVMSNKEVINYPVQGSAFHWLLWCLIKLNGELTLMGWSSRIIGQVHDSIIFDVKPSELGGLLKLVRRVMTKDILEHWDWICVPLNVEAEVSEVGGNWFEMKEVKI